MTTTPRQGAGDLWYVNDRGQTFGPVSGAVVAQWVAEGRLSPQACFARVGSLDWLSREQAFGSAPEGVAPAMDAGRLTREALLWTSREGAAELSKVLPLPLKYVPTWVGLALAAAVAVVVFAAFAWLLR